MPDGDFCRPAAGREEPASVALRPKPERRPCLRRHCQAPTRSVQSRGWTRSGPANTKSRMRWSASNSRGSGSTARSRTGGRRARQGAVHHRSHAHPGSRRIDALLRTSAHGHRQRPFRPHVRFRPCRLRIGLPVRIHRSTRFRCRHRTQGPTWPCRKGGKFQRIPSRQGSTASDRARKYDPGGHPNGQERIRSDRARGRNPTISIIFFTEYVGFPDFSVAMPTHISRFTTFCLSDPDDVRARLRTRFRAPCPVAS